MNNEQFRKLVQNAPARQSSLSERDGTAPKRDIAAPVALGSRVRSSIPMTPRSVAVGSGVDFSRQLAERERASSNQPAKKFRSSAAPKGAKLPAGYTDRTKERVSDEDDEKAVRVKALEEMVKLQQIDQDAFEKMRDEIIGGDVGSVHLVKGLDFKLLERVRRGEDVLNVGLKNKSGDEDRGGTPSIDDELEKLEDREVAPMVREKIKKGQMADPSLIPGKKRNRDQIIAELKASRQGAKERAVPSLGARFKKVGAPQTSSKIETDSKGREVLVTVDEQGIVKRKVRRVQLENKVEKGYGLLMPDKDAKPLGMEIPEAPKSALEEDQDINIFDDVGDDYNPLAGLEDGEDSEAEDGDAFREEKDRKDIRPLTVTTSPSSESSSLARPNPPVKPRNYFGDPKEVISEVSAGTGSKEVTDSSILAALKKASSLASRSELVKTHEELARENKLREMLEAQERDAVDMDLGFGSSRFGDEEDFGDEKIKISEWGTGGDDHDSGKGSGKAKRKRGPKKRKGDGNNAADVLRVIEGRKAATS